MVQSWKRARMAYYTSLAVLFAAIALYFGPNYMLFGKLTWITPADFAGTARMNVEPIVRAIKEYAADYGEMPSLRRPVDEQLVPRYLPPRPGGGRYLAVMIANDTVAYRSKWNHTITYTFAPEREGWYVRGAFTSGPIPLPIVTLDPARRATSRPTTQPH